MVLVVSYRVHVLEDAMEGQVNGVIYGPVGPVGKMQGVQERVCETSKVLNHEALTAEVRATGL